MIASSDLALSGINQGFYQRGIDRLVHSHIEENDKAISTYLRSIWLYQTLKFTQLGADAKQVATR